MTDGNGHHNPATPQEIWEMLREITAGQQETDRRMQETDRQMQETDRRLQARGSGLCSAATVFHQGPDCRRLEVVALPGSTREAEHRK